MGAFYIVTPIVGVVLSIVLAGLVIKQHPHSPLHRIFSIFLFLMGLWALSIFCMRVSPNLSSALFWEKVTFTILPLVSVSFYHSALNLTGSRDKFHILPVAHTAVIAFMLIVLFTDWVILRMQIMWYGVGFVGGILLVPYVTVMYGIVVIALVHLIQAYRKSHSPLEKSRYLYVALGGAVCLCGLLFDILAARGFPIYPMGIVSNIIFSVLCAYAILRYNLLDVPVVIRRGAVYAIVSILGIGLVIGILSFTYVFGIDAWLAEDWQKAILIVVIAIGLQPLLVWVQGRVDRLFNRAKYDYLRALENMVDETKAITALGFIAGSLVNSVAASLKCRSVTVLLPDTEEANYVPVAHRGPAEIMALRLNRNSALVWWLNTREKIMTREQLDTMPHFHALSMRERDMLEKLEAQLFVPLLTREGLRGIMILGKKLSELEYSPEETRMLRLVAGQMATVLDNARLYDLLKRQYEEQALLARLSMIVSSELELGKVCEQFIKELAKVVLLDYAGINLIKERGGEAESYFTWSVFVDLKSSVDSMPMDAASMLVNQGLVYESDITQESRFPADTRFKESGIRTVLRLLLESKSGMLGMLTLASRQSGAYNEDKLSLLRQVAIQLAIGIDKSRLYEAERNARLELEKQYNERTEFINSLIHEVKTPLTAMLASTELLREELSGEASLLGDLAENLDNAAHNLDRRISELVDFVKFQSTETKLNLQYIDFNEVARRAVAHASGLFRTKYQTLNLDVPSTPGPVYADPDRLLQVLLNLLTNASKYSNPSTAVWLRVKVQDNEIIAELQDSAMPIEAKDAELIFTPYPRITRKSSGGLGLGLFICKRLIQLHGGKIWLETGNNGNRFKFALPVTSPRGDV